MEIIQFPPREKNIWFYAHIYKNLLLKKKILLATKNPEWFVNYFKNAANVDIKLTKMNNESYLVELRGDQQ